MNRKPFDVNECREHCRLTMLNTPAGKWLEAALLEIERLRFRLDAATFPMGNPQELAELRRICDELAESLQCVDATILPSEHSLTIRSEFGVITTGHLSVSCESIRHTPISDWKRKRDAALSAYKEVCGDE